MGGSDRLCEAVWANTLQDINTKIDLFFTMMVFLLKFLWNLKFFESHVQVFPSRIPGINRINRIEMNDVVWMNVNWGSFGSQNDFFKECMLNKHTTRSGWGEDETRTQLKLLVAPSFRTEDFCKYSTIGIKFYFYVIWSYFTCNMSKVRTTKTWNQTSPYNVGCSIFIHMNKKTIKIFQLPNKYFARLTWE